MAFRITTHETGFQNIADTSAVQQHALGTTVTAIDPTYGQGEFIYLIGVGSTVVGSLVTWTSAHQTVLGATTSRGLVAFAMSINTAGLYGWYQISGVAVAKAGTVVTNSFVQVGAAGIVDDTATTLLWVDNAYFRSADGTPSAGLALVQCNRPCVPGRSIV
jgi:hypothetical protein